MPTISPKDKVLVTGANGYIGLWVVQYLLERGYKVRAAVRSDNKGNTLEVLFKEKLPEQAANLEYVLVKDIGAVRLSSRIDSLLSRLIARCAGTRFRCCCQRRRWSHTHCLSYDARDRGPARADRTCRGRHTEPVEERPLTRVSLAATSCDA